MVKLILFIAWSHLIGVLSQRHHPHGSKAHDGTIPELGYQDPYPGTLVEDTTQTIVPQLFETLLRGIAPIDESVTDHYAAKDAVDKLEASAGWDPVTSDFKNSAQLDALKMQGVLTAKAGECTATKADIVDKLLKGKKLYEVMDVILPTIRDTSEFFDKWKDFIKDFHVILIQDGDPTKVITVPDWVHFELYNRNDIIKALGDKSWIISDKDSSIRNFGFLLSKKRYVWSVDDDCFPATGPDGKLVNALVEHAYNLLTPSVPYFFNTVYDPYQPCVDFVRGYPFSLRRGVQTVVSHGLWMNTYDYDAPTQLLKVHERNHKYIDTSLTVPYRILYPLCSMNVAFDRELLGPALMQGE